MQVFDTIGNIIENGDSLVPEKIYIHNAYPSSSITQSSLILPKGINNEFYVFIPTLSDSAYDFYITNLGAGGTVPIDLLLYDVVDMKANGGLGKVTSKNNKLLQNVSMNKVMMQACRHSNGRDWWLLKQRDYNTNEIIRFLITEDSISGPFIQTFQEPKYGYYDLTGQFAFSKNGKKLAAVQGKSNKLFLADFDRCTGELSNPQVFNIPIDSTSYPVMDSTGARDSISAGVSFSSNGKFIYISKWWNIYQFEIDEPDSSLAWFNVKRGTDTTWAAFEFYGSLQRGVDERIYIGKWGGGFKQLSVIDKPDEKGAACSFCRKCLRIDSGAGGSTAPPNMPDYTLAADTTSPCWPLQNENVKEERKELEVYPNPAYDRIVIKNAAGKQKILFNTLGQILFTTYQDEIDISHWVKGLYFIKCGNYAKKLLVE